MQAEPEPSTHQVEPQPSTSKAQTPFQVGYDNAYLTLMFPQGQNVSHPLCPTLTKKHYFGPNRYMIYIEAGTFPKRIRISRYFLKHRKVM